MQALPSARAYLPAVHDPMNDRMAVMGGFDGGHKNDVWAFTNATAQGGTSSWEPLAPASGPPSERRGHTGVYDAASGRMVVFGGLDLAAFNNDVWVLTNATGLGGTPEWTRLLPIGGPPSGRFWHTSIFDAASDRMVVFGGDDGVSKNDAWVLMNATGLGGIPSWTQLSPTGVPPDTRRGHGAVYDATSNRMVVFGGWNGTEFKNDVWVLTNATGLGGTPSWIQLSPTGTPPTARERHPAVYNTTHHRMVVFGGYDNAPNNDVWVLANATGLGGTPSWIRLSPIGGPPAVRGGHAAVYDESSNRMVVFGGYDGSSLRNDVWVLRNATGLGGTPSWISLGAPPAPLVVSTSPLNGATNVPISSAVTITFSLAMDLVATQAAITSSPIIPGTFGWSAGNTLVTWTPSSSLSPGTQYTVSISTAARSAAGVSLLSAYAFAFTTASSGSSAPAAPMNLQAIGGDSTVALTWSPPSSNGGVAITNYRIHRGTQSGGEVFLAEIGNLTSYGDTGLTNGLTYYYQVSAVNPIGEGPRSGEMSATPVKSATAPTAPLSPRGHAGNAQVTLTWDLPSSDGGSPITNYKVYGGTSPNPGGVVGTPSGTNFTHAGLVNGAIHYYAVAAVNAVGEGPRSAEVQATPTSAVVPTPPAVVSTMPLNGATDVSPGTNIAVYFDMPMDRAASEGAFSISPAVAVAFAWGNVEGTLMIDPTSDLAAGAKYTVAISTAAKSTAGAPLPSQHSFSFTTRATPAPKPPTISHTVPGSVDEGAAIEIKATVTSESPLLAVTLRYRQGAPAPFKSVGMTRSSGDEYISTVPGTDVKAGRMEYYIEAQNSAPEKATSPPKAPVALHTITVKKMAPTPRSTLDWMIVGVVFAGLFLAILALLMLHRRRSRSRPSTAWDRRNQPSSVPPGHAGFRQGPKWQTRAQWPPRPQLQQQPPDARDEVRETTLKAHSSPQKGIDLDESAGPVTCQFCHQTIPAGAPFCDICGSIVSPR